MGGKYSIVNPNKGMTSKDYQRIHPIWRGVGFGMMVLIPVIAFAGQDVLIKSGKIPLPVDMYAKPGEFLYSLIPDPLLYIRIMFFIAILAVLFALFTLFSFLINSMFGITQRRDPFYVPPVTRRIRKRK